MKDFKVEDIIIDLENEIKTITEKNEKSLSDLEESNEKIAQEINLKSMFVTKTDQKFIFELLDFIIVLPPLIKYFLYPKISTVFHLCR